MIYPILITENSVTVIKSGKRLTCHNTHPCFAKIINRIRAKNYNNIEQLFKLKDVFEKCFNVEVRNNQVTYKGHPVHNVICDKILTFIRDGLPYRGLMKFMDKLMQNPEPYCRDQLYSYIERYGLAIDDDGFVYAWKAVDSDLKDKYTHKLDYSPGKVVRMDRDKCDKNPEVGCGQSLHLGNSSYVLTYGDKEGDRFILCKFNPKDVVSCPTDCEWQKLRVTKIHSLKEVTKDSLQPLSTAVVSKKERKTHHKVDTKLNYTVQRRNKLGQFV